MRPIPKTLREEMAADRFYQRCCITNFAWDKIEWHHAFIFAGRQVNEKWCIVPLSQEVHKNVHLYRDKIDWIILNRADEATLRKYSRSEDLLAKRARLNKKFGLYPH